MAIPNPVSFWNLDESSGNAADAFGPNTLTNTGVTFTTGKIGNAADFERGDSTDVLSIADGSQSGLDFSADMSISAWVYLESVPSNIGVIASKWNPSAASDLSYRFSVGYDDSRLYLETSSTGSNELVSYCAWSPSTATWYHVAVTYDGGASAGSRVKLYVNGAAQTMLLDDAPATLPNSGQSFNIGNNGANRQFDGLIDAVGVWNVTLTSGEVSELYNAGNGKQYPFMPFFSVSDTCTATDTATSTRARLFSVLDTATLSEVVTAARGVLFSILDTVTGSEVVTALRARIASVLDTVTASEVLAQVRALWSRPTRDATSFTKPTRDTSSWTRPDNPNT